MFLCEIILVTVSIIGALGLFSFGIFKDYKLVEKEKNSLKTPNDTATICTIVFMFILSIIGGVLIYGLSLMSSILLLF